jgi:uncharacterized protein (DUF433 family)
VAKPDVLHGAYPADRAAALAGMPLSTLHYWARHDVVVPRVSASRPKLWSFEDLMALRAVVWLRRAKTTPDGESVRPSSMPVVRQAIAALRDLDLDIWEHSVGVRVLVDVAGRIFVQTPSGAETPRGQLMAHSLDLVEPFEADGRHGPNLLRPRDQLRIVPGKLSGAPHIVETRIETEALAALRARGFAVDEIAELYPIVDRAAIDDALDLEAQLGTVAVRGVAA